MALRISEIGIGTFRNLFLGVRLGNRRSVVISKAGFEF